MTMIPQGAGPVHTKQAWRLRVSGFFTAILGLCGLWQRVVVCVDEQWAMESAKIRDRNVEDLRQNCRWFEEQLLLILLLPICMSKEMRDNRLSEFLVACTRLYKPLCRLVRLSVCWLVRQSVHLSLLAWSTRLMAIGLVVVWMANDMNSNTIAIVFL